MEEQDMLHSACSYLESIKHRNTASANDGDHQFGLYIASELQPIKDDRIKKIIKLSTRCNAFYMKCSLGLLQ